MASVFRAPQDEGLQPHLIAAAQHRGMLDQAPFGEGGAAARVTRTPASHLSDARLRDAVG
jgi:hypothetical protein